MAHGRTRFRRVRGFARVGVSALPAFSVRAATQDHRGSIAGQEVPSLDRNPCCATPCASRDEAHRLPANGACSDEAVRTTDRVVRTDRHGRGLRREDGTEHRLPCRRLTQLDPRHVCGRDHLESIFDAAVRARARRRPWAFAATAALTGPGAGMRDMAGERRLDAPFDAAREAVGAVGAAEIVRRQPSVTAAGGAGSIGPDAPTRGVGEPRRKTSTLAAAFTRERRKRSDRDRRA